ncbi:hypothetical protein SAMN04487995_0249 [Dyadobacter koreensis]|uniref:Uncharacterized protein n=1 Tax=Dyadobacter koreensis TaxID=408657 RepID=A0A1H6QDX3_9BACT|nr:hypothetical protein SAMN04487995_0249 [Dyadobacter koreensis]
MILTLEIWFPIHQVSIQRLSFATSYYAAHEQGNRLLKPSLYSFQYFHDIAKQLFIPLHFLIKILLQITDLLVITIFIKKGLGVICITGFMFIRQTELAGV